MENKKMEMFELVYKYDRKCSANMDNESLYKLLVARFAAYMDVLDILGWHDEYTNYAVGRKISD